MGLISLLLFYAFAPEVFIFMLFTSYVCKTSKLITTVFALFLSFSLFSCNMVYAPFYEDHIPYCNEIANTAQAYADAENARLIPSLDMVDMVDETITTLFVVGHGNQNGIINADGSLISWSALIAIAVKNGVETLVIDSCSSGSAILVAQHMKLSFSLEIFTSSNADEPSRAVIGGTSIYSQMWIADCVASYNAGGLDIFPQYATFN